MKDRQRLFLDKITKLLVDDTRIDYDKGSIYYPFLLHLPYSDRSLSSLKSSTFKSSYIILYSTFYRYCKNSYGLTGNETEYVWNEYKSIINDKIKNNER